MNNKVKKWLIITIALQIILLVFPAVVKATNQYIIEKDAPVKGKEFTFTLSHMAVHDNSELYVSFSLENPLEYYSSNQKIQISTDESGNINGYKYKGENDWYIYGRYYSNSIAVEKLQFCEGYDFSKLDTILYEKEIKEQWHFSSEPWNTKYFEAEMSAIVYKGLIIPKAIYIDGVKVADII